MGCHTSKPLHCPQERAAEISVSEPGSQFKCRQSLFAPKVPELGPTLLGSVGACGVKEEDIDVLIVGGGSIGLATAWRLGATGKSVVVLEKFGFFNDEGSSAGASRQFRLQYSEEYLSKMVLASVPYWEELQKHTTATLIDRVGSLWFGDPELSSTEGGISAAIDTMKKLNIPFTPMDAKQIQAEFPFKNLPANYSGFFQKDGGIINLKATQEAAYNAACAYKNVSLREYEPVTTLSSTKEHGIRVETSKTCYRPRKLVLTGGPYTNELLNMLGVHINMNLWEMSSSYFKRDEDHVRLPTWYVFQKPQSERLFYGFPEVDWAHPGYVRVAPDIPDRVIHDPSQRTGVPSAHSLANTSHWVSKHMVGLDKTPEFTSTCLVALSQDGSELFFLDRLPIFVPNNEDICVCCAGWAAKFIPLFGELLAQLVTKGTTSVDISPFSVKWRSTSPSQTSPRFISSIAEDLELDVAIVGGGASGLYSGYRLLTGTTEQGNAPKRNVQIFELSERVGGRLQSHQLPGMDVVGELGGMRYMTSQEIVTGLIEKVFVETNGLEAIGFPMGDSESTLFYLRQQRFFQNRFTQANVTGEHFNTHYFVGEKWQGKSADDLFQSIVATVLAADGYDLAQIQASKNARHLWNDVKQNLRYNFPGPYRGRYVYEIGFWNLLKDQTDQETYAFLSAAGGYYSNTINWNAAEAFPYMVGDFADSSVKYKSIRGGYDQVLSCLASSFMDAGGVVRTCNKLVTFVRSNDDASEHRYVLTFYNTLSQRTWKVHAKDIILALPRRSLELLDQTNFFFSESRNQKLQANLRSVVPEPSFKLMLGFEHAWWGDLHATWHAEAALSITDLPLRQCYYFGTDKTNGHSLLVASYNDMRTVSFWKPLEQGERFKVRRTSKVGLEELENLPFRASRAMVEEAMQQLREMHGSSIEIPEPYVSAYKDWTEDPYGGGYHAWCANYKVWDVMPFMRHAFEDERVFIVGEAYSDQQGWVEGAFCVSEHVMREKFGLTCPDWLRFDYYLGW
jgi:glycine/D-amino acid oxidase-like deaminating enzyme